MIFHGTWGCPVSPAPGIGKPPGPETERGQEASPTELRFDVLSGGFIWFNWDDKWIILEYSCMIPFGYLLHFAIENGHRKFVSCPISMVDLPIAM